MGIDPRQDPLSFGNIALAWGWISESDLDKALGVQEQRKPLGEILVELGVITPIQRDVILAEQDRRKAGNNHSKGIVAEMTFQRNLMKHLSMTLSDAAVMATSAAAILAHVKK